jgi:hypothetical protein
MEPRRKRVSGVFWNVPLHIGLAVAFAQDGLAVFRNQCRAVEQPQFVIALDERVQLRGFVGSEGGQGKEQD